MKSGNHIISENTAKRMQILAGFEPVETINESLLSRVAGILGISVATLGSALAQSPQDFQKLQKLGYDQKTISTLQHAMTDSAVVGKLTQIGIPKNNIDRAVREVENGYKVEMDHGKTKTYHHKAHNEDELLTLMKQGYHLTNVQVDTLIDTVRTVRPKTHVIQLPLILNDKFRSAGEVQSI